MAKEFLKIRTGVGVTPSTAPADPTNGDIYYDSGSGLFKFYQSGSWTSIPTSIVSTVGALDAQTPSANGLVISGTSIYAQSASASAPGLVNTAAQTLAGAKTFSTSIATPSFKLNGATSGTLTMSTPATVTSYGVVWPSAQGGASTYLQNDGSGNLSWGTVSSPSNTPVWTKYTISHTSLQAGATSNDIELVNLPQKTMIHQVVLKHSTAFAGTSITAYTVSVGIASNFTKYTSAFDVFQSVSNTARSITQSEDVESFTGATSIRIQAISTGANLSASTAGSVDVWVLSSVLT